VEERRFSAALASKLTGALAPARGTRIRTYNLCFLGFGNVNRTLARLLRDREQELRQRHGITFRITGVSTRSLGWIADPQGLDPDAYAYVDRARVERSPMPARSREASQKLANVRDWLSAAHANILFEATALNAETGQPAIDHIRAALEHGAHAITANKGPIVHAYCELRDLAVAKGKRFLFESTVMDGVPIFSLFHELPVIHLQGFHGILNSTTNVILSEMESGLSLDESLKKAQALGVAETDATHDIDGWDAAVKTAALITVLMDVPVKLEDIAREGIRDLSTNAVRNGRRDGWPFKLVCRAQRVGSGVKASVAPEKVLSSSPMGKISGTSSYVYFETDIFPGLAITEENPGLYATAYGMLADFVRAVS
jgi:homoserine dehydrogenase